MTVRASVKYNMETGDPIGYLSATGNMGTRLSLDDVVTLINDLCDVRDRIVGVDSMSFEAAIAGIKKDHADEPMTTHELTEWVRGLVNAQGITTRRIIEIEEKLKFHAHDIANLEARP